jgi:heme/copper-type cytochrome/quinol oxidase subunit 3
MNPSDIVNVTEIILWSSFGIGFAVIATRRRGTQRIRLFVLALAFLAFGLSDYLELQTGAWWRPLWLLVLKAACVAVFFLALRRHLREKASVRSATAAETKDPPAPCSGD